MELKSLGRWIDNDFDAAAGDEEARGIDWPRVIPFIGLHLARKRHPGER